MPNESEVRLGQGEGHECNTRQLGSNRLYLTLPICQFQLSVKKIKFIYWVEDSNSVIKYEPSNLGSFPPGHQQEFYQLHVEF